MYSNKFDYDYGEMRPQSSRGSRPWDEEDRREKWKEPSRSSVRETYDKYIAEKHKLSERENSSDYSEPYKREYNSDTDWRNEHTSSHDRSVSNKRRRTQEDDDQYRYSHDPEDSYRQAPMKHSQRNKNFKGTMSIDDGYNRRRTPEYSRSNQDQFHYSEYNKDSHYQPVSQYYKDRDSRERSRSPDRTRPREDFIKSYSPQRLSDSFSRDHEDRNHNRNLYSLNGSSRLHEPSHRRLSPPPPPPPPAAAGEKTMSKGFQRFLDVLNMGVNMETLTQIVTHGSPNENVRQRLSPPHTDRSWTAEPSPRQNPQQWSQSESRHQRERSSHSSNGKLMLEESPLESRHFEKKFPSPTVNTPGSEEDHKCKQMHDVLQALGIKLEFEELGQMSSRIQERLYGKKQPEIAQPNQKEEEERDKMRPAYVPQHRSPPPSPYLPPNLPFAMPNMFMPPPPPFPPPYFPALPVPLPNIYPPTGPLSAPVPQPQNKNRRSYLNLITVPTKK